MKRTILSGLAIITSLAACAQTIISTPAVSGHWTATGSPYIINTSIYVPTGSTLTIDPGVDVRFAGMYNFTVAGKLVATGSATSPISFHAQDTMGWHNDTAPAGGWGGLYFQVFGDTGSILKYCNISDCKYGTDTGGFATSRGAISAYRQVELQYCNIFHNQALSNLSSGSVIMMYYNEGMSRIEHCKIHDNKTVWSTVNFNNGGTMSVEFNNNEVYNNTANRPVWFSNVKGNVTGNDLHDNNSMLQGGTITIEYNSVLSVKGNKIHHNKATTNGALTCASSVVDINGNLICNNTATSTAATCGLMDGGGGIQLSGNGAGTLNSFLVRNNVIANNRTEFNGGAMTLIYANTDIVNNTIVNNSAATGGGIYIMDNAQTVNIKNNILYGNGMATYVGMDYAPGVYIFQGYHIGFDNNYTAHGYKNECYMVMPYTLTGDTVHNVIAADAMLTAPTATNTYTDDATGANFSLHAGSPCINSGDSTGAICYATDYMGNPRIMGNKIDIGAIEYNGTQPSGLMQVTPSVEMAAFPNPAHDVVNISLPAASGNVEITNITGQIVAQQQVTQQLFTINTQQLAPGTYFIKWADSHNRTATTKIVKE